MDKLDVHTNDLDGGLAYSHHLLILLVGAAVAGLALLAAIAIGPDGRRGVRISLAIASLGAFLGTAYWLVAYLSLIEQRRAIEIRLAELRAQALNAGSALACLERTGDIIENACEQTVFASPEALAAANFYTATRLDLLSTAAKYSGPRTLQFDGDLAALQRSLQQDPFGLTANVLVLREGCTENRCDAMKMFRNPRRLWENIRLKTFDVNATRHAGAWKMPVPNAASSVPASTTPNPASSAARSQGVETKAPIPDKYTLPSSTSIPPVSIMNEEPLESPAPTSPVKDRPTIRTPRPAAAPPSTDQPSPRREKGRPNPPLSISPTQ